ncbi:LPD38 domain-containing protein [Thauera butanivorans]|uniref:LPD38 domain-containing protein n=1 Tax=Thauera butanivorans TaxID=86174 RepID=UPI003AB4F821
MSAIQEFKKQYPAYAAVPDEELAAALHAKFYSSMPREAFMERVGLAEASILERASDLGLDLSRGVVGLGESVVGVADLLTGNRVGNALRDTLGYDPKRTKDIIASGYSAERRRENAAVQDAEGFIGTIEALIDNPAVALGSMGESAPMMLGSAAAVRAAAVRMLGAAGIAPGTQAAAAYLRQPGVVAKLATIGSAAEGATAAGSIQSEARQEGREWSESAPYAVAGGVGTAVIGKVASRLLPDVDVGLGVAGLGAGGRTSALEAAKQIGRGTIQEGVLEELPQSAQEQVAQNLAMGKPWDEGVPEAAAQGMVAGLGMGAGGSGARVALDSYTARTTDATSGMEFDQAAIEAAARAQLDPDMAQMELRRRADAAQADIANAQNISSAVEAFANATAATSDDLNLGTLQTEAMIGQREAAAIDQADLLRRAQLAAGIEQEADPLAVPTMPEFSAGTGYGQPLDVAPLEQMPAGMPLDLRLPEREQPIQPDRAPIMPDFTAGTGYGQQSEVMPLEQAPVDLPLDRSYLPDPVPEQFPVAPGAPMPEPRPPVDVPYADTTIEQARAAIQADPMRPKTAQLEGEGIIGTFTSKTAAAVAARIVRKTLPDTQLDVVQQGERWALVPQQVAPTTQPSAARPFDHGELNIPGRTNGINAELDRWKADQVKAKRAQAKTDAATRKAQKAEAQQLFTQFGPAMIDRYAPKFGRKEIEQEFDSMVKWEPAKFIDLVQRFEREERAAAPAAAPQRETETPDAAPSTPATAPAFAPGQTAKGRDVLLAQVEQLKTRTAPADLVKDYNGLKARIADARRRASLKATKRAEATKLTEWADNQDRELERLRNEIGFVELKAGTSRFKVLNTPQNLDAFAQKLKKAPVGRWTVTVKPEEIYDNVETRPGTTEKQRDAGRSAITALVDRVNARSARSGGGSATVLCHRLLESFSGTGGADLVGQTVSSAEDLATLAQVFRDPRFETFRVFYTDASGAIVGEAAYSSRLPAAVRLPNDLEARISADMSRFGAAGFWVLHNHPSGRATPSADDISLTRAIASNTQGFRGHVVIDFNEYATIDAAGVVSVIQAPQLNGTDFFGNPERDHAMLGTVLQGEQDVVKAAKALQVPQGHAALILTRRDGAVQLLMDVPMSMLQAQTSKGLGKLKGALRGFARESGSGGFRFIVLPAGVSPQSLTKLVTSGLITDVVSADGTTASNFGAFWTGDFLDQNMPVRQVKDETEERTVRAPATPYQAGQPQPTTSTPPAETRARAFQRRTQDKFNRFTVIQSWLKDRGINLTEQADVYRAEERMHGRAATRIEDFREKRMKPIVEKIRAAGFSMAEVADFLHAQHAEERNAQIATLNSEMPDGGSGMTTADARAKLARYRTQPELVRLANELQAITQDTKRILLEAGIITQEMAAAWDATYQHYVPLKGGPEEDAANQGTGRGLTVKQKNKRALGHGTREEWIIENILRDHERAILQAEKNRVGQHLLALAIEAGHEDLITIGKPAKRQVLKDTVHYEVRYHGSTVEVFRSLADAQRFVGIEALKPGRSKKDFAIQASHDLDVVMMPSPVLEPNETQVHVDGHAVRIQFKDEGLARAWNNLGAESFNVVMRMAREVNTFLSRAYTGWNPEFILVNVFRDLGTGVLNLAGEEGGRFALNALKNYPRAFAELLKYAHTGNASNWIAQYRADGGTTGAAYLSDLERIGKDVQGAYDEAAGVIQTWRNGGSYRAARAAVREILGPFVRWIEKLNQAGENAMRLAAYRTAVEMGQTRARAAALAKNATVNFNRNGELGQTIGSLYLFANPAIQGTASIAHALFKGKHKHQAQALTGAIVAAGYTMAALNGGGPEDEYEKLPEFQKERFMPIWTGDGWVKIPIPYGYGFFATMGRQLAALEKGEDPAKVSLRLASSFVEEFSVWGAAADPEGDEKNVTFLLPTIPQIVMAPIINKTGLGAPVYPESPFDQSKPDNLKMWRTTQGAVFHDAAKGLNALTGGDAVQKGWLDISPETLRYLWTTATGGTGRFFTDTAALAKNLAVEGLEARDIESREVPIVRKFVGPANDIRGARARFWEAAEEVREAQEAFARAKKLEDVAERNDLARQIQAENRELLALGKALDARTKAIKHERDLIDAIMADESRTLSERRVMVREVEARERRLYDEFVAEFKERTH